MNKNIFIKSTLILVLGGFLTKILGMIIKVFTTRIVGTEGIGLYMLITPTFNLFITLSQLGFPIAISKLVSEDKTNNKKIIFSTIFVSIIFNTLLILLIFLIAPFMSNILLKNSNTYLPIVCIGFTLPFIGISSIARGYFFGKQKMIPHVVSNVFEQIIRLIIIIFITPILLKRGINFAVAGLVIYNVVSELLSILILYFYLPKKFRVTKEELKPDKSIIKDVMQISIPTTSSRLVGSLGYFLEPIIITQTMLLVGYSTKFITYEYGIISGYVIQTLLMPSFFAMAISQALIPVISKSYSNGHIKHAKEKIKQACVISFSIGLIVTSALIIFPKFFLKLFYNTTEGVNYLRVLAPFFLIFYIQGPLTSALQAMNKARDAFSATLIGIIIKCILLFGLSLLRIGMYPLIIATIVNVLYVTLHHYKLVNKSLKNK
ncbi:MAG: polysaccharide biosynthesis protein [Bacilli bacterium]|nr:polysaccharide biosynthesis protein [Bacilli bacterium]